MAQVDYVVCVSRDGFEEFATDDITLGRQYEVTSRKDKFGLIRVIDDSGEEYEYPAKLFEASTDASCG